MSDADRAEILSQLQMRSFLSKQGNEAEASVTTRRGDAGTTFLMFDRQVPKWHPRIRLLGQLDLVNSQLNFLRLCEQEKTRHEIRRVQEALVYVMGEFATHEDDIQRFFEFFHHISESDLNELDEVIERLETCGAVFSRWVEELGAGECHADCARALTRQAESMAWELAESHGTRTVLAVWLNRLSDYLWALSRKSFKP